MADKETPIEILIAARDKMLESVAKALTEASVYDVSSVEREGYRKFNFQGIYIHTYKTYGKSARLRRKFERISNKIWVLLRKTRIYVTGVNRQNASGAFYFWVKERLPQEKVI